MTATVRVYKQSDTSAPTLTGQAGSLTTLLDAVLVNGYGSSTAAGWTIGQTTTNKRQYINSAVDGTGFSVWIDDAAPTTAKEARCTGFESMSGLGTGSGQFPLGGQVNIGTTPNGAVICRKSTTADSTARNWTIFADDTCFYLFAETGDQTSPVGCYCFMFGDIFSYKSSDAYRCMIVGRITENTANVATLASFVPTALIDGFGSMSLTSNTTLSNVVDGHFMARQYTGVGGSLAVGKIADVAKMGQPSVNPVVGMQCGFLGTWTTGGQNTGTTWNTEFIYPNGPDSGLYVSPMWVIHTGYVRGYLKGLFCPLQNLPGNHNDTYSGTNNLSGLSFTIMGVVGLSSASNAANTLNAVQVHMQTTSPWS